MAHFTPFLRLYNLLGSEFFCSIRLVYLLALITIGCLAMVKLSILLLIYVPCT